VSEKTGVLDETGQVISKERDVVEPLVQHMKDRPVSAALIILAIGFVLGAVL
jgi:hypothetical protein